MLRSLNVSFNNLNWELIKPILNALDTYIKKNKYYLDFKQKRKKQINYLIN